MPPFISLPFPPDVTGSLPPSVVLPEESRIAKLSPSGWTIGAGLRARVSKNMSITGSYAWTDFGTAKLAPTQRLGPVKIESKIEAWRLTLGYRF